MAAACLQACESSRAQLASPPGKGMAEAEPTAPAVLVGDVPFSRDELARILELSPLPPPPADPTNAWADDPRAARLGQALFYDPRFSASGTVSCSTCHDPARGWADGRDLAQGEGPLERHAMTLWNVAYSRWLFWDGRADSLWAQALHPFEGEQEQGITRLQVLRLVRADAGLRDAYEDVFGALPDMEDRTRFPDAARPVPDRPTHSHHVAWTAMAPEDRESVNRAYANLGKSVAAFERRIVSRRAPFDVFAEGVREGDPEEQWAIDDAARRGLKLYLGKGRCHLCHSGPELTDREFHDTRVRPRRGRALDPGRVEGIAMVRADPFNGIGSYSDAATEDARDKVAHLRVTSTNWGEFKTPTLRNVALTAPYMHLGQLDTLEQVLEHYSTLANALPKRHEFENLLLPVHFTVEEKADMLAFLESLTDAALPPELLKPPSPRNSLAQQHERSP